MMLRTSSCSALLLAATTIGALCMGGVPHASAAAYKFDTRGSKLAPNILMLLDNSGSMERTANQALPGGACAGVSGAVLEKNRWQSVVDSLGGPLVGGCAMPLDRSQAPFGALYGSSVYDRTYGFPHYRYGLPITGSEICTLVPKNTTGSSPPSLLDLEYRSMNSSGAIGASCTVGQSGYDNSKGFFAALAGKARIGMMMFDNDPDPGTSMTGLWSYGTPAKVSYPGCTNNNMEVGARNPSAPMWEGRLVGFPQSSPAVPADEFKVTDGSTNLEELRAVLRTSRPYGATPLAGLLADAKEYLSTSSSCHDQVVVLLTDGGPNLDGLPACLSGSCPYGSPKGTADVVAKQLLAMGIQTYVIGFAVTGGAGTGYLPNSASVPNVAACTPTTCSNSCSAWFNSCGTDTASRTTGLKDRCNEFRAASSGTYWAGKFSPDDSYDLANACCTLHETALEGGTGMARFAESASDMAAVISELQSKILATADSRTVPVSTPRTAAGQSTYGTAYVAGGGTGIARGDIQRVSGYVCNGSSTTPVTVTPTSETSIGTRLGLQAFNRDRDFFTVRTSADVGRTANMSIQPASYDYGGGVVVTNLAPMNIGVNAVYDPKIACAGGLRNCVPAVGAHMYSGTAAWPDGSYGKEFLDWNDFDLKLSRTLPSGAVVATAEFSQPYYYSVPAHNGGLAHGAAPSRNDGPLYGTDPGRAAGPMIGAAAAHQEYVPGMRLYNGLDMTMLSFATSTPMKPSEFQRGPTGAYARRMGCYFGSAVPSAADLSEGDAQCASLGFGVCNVMASGNKRECSVQMPAAAPGTCGAGGDLGEGQCPFNVGQFRCAVGDNTCNALGPIATAVPVIVGPPNEFLPDPSYAGFAADMATDSRSTATPKPAMPAIMYVQEGGMLHAFDTTLGVSRVELWSFIPPGMHSSLPGLYPTMAYPLLDTTPVVRDVPFLIQESEGGYVSDATLTALKSRWRRVLVSGLGDVGALDYQGGEGRVGRGYYAVDVTQPFVNNDEKLRTPADNYDQTKIGGPKFLWQLTDVPGSKLASAPSPGARSPDLASPTGNANPLVLPTIFGSMNPADIGGRGSLFGQATGTPAITTIAYRDRASVNYANQVAVAILPGGLDAAPARDSAKLLLTCSARQTHTTTAGPLPLDHDLSKRAYDAKGLAGDNVTPLTNYKLHAAHLCWGPACYAPSYSTSTGCNQVVKGRYVVISRMDTGEVIRVFGRKADFAGGSWGATTNTSLSDVSAAAVDSRAVIDTPFDAPMSGTPVVYPMNTGAVATKFFMSDAEGVIWRFDISSNNPSNWRADIFFDTRSQYTNSTSAEDWRQVDVPIELSTNDAGELVLFVATGEQKKLIDSTAENYVYSLTEKTDGTVGRAYVNYVHKLPPGRRVVGPMVVNDGYVYYSIFQAATPSGTCTNDVPSLLCVRHYKDPLKSGSTVLTDKGGQQPSSSPVPGCTLTPGSDDCCDMGEPVQSGVSIRSAPSCVVTATDPAYGAMPPTPGAASSPDMSLVWTTGVKVAGGVPEVKIGEKTVTQSTGARRTILDSWVAILE